MATKNIFIIGAAIIFVLISGCKEDNSDELKAEEDRLLQNYLMENNITTEPEPSGLYYIEKESGNGQKAETDNWVILDYTAKLLKNEAVFGTTIEEIAKEENIYQSEYFYRPTKWVVGYITLNGILLPGLNEGLAMMEQGDRSTLIIPSEIGLGGKSTNIVPPYSTLIFDLKVHEVIEDIVAHENKNFQDYLDTLMTTPELYLDIDTTSTGVYFFQTEKGDTTITPEINEFVRVFYTGYFFDGTVFDTNESQAFYRFQVGKGTVIPGWDEGIQLIEKGSKGILVVPWDQAYGETGSATIPPYENLVFDIQLLSD
jgi:FKBP-type peptidyl-prolyl cis-trans isomerase